MGQGTGLYRSRVLKIEKEIEGKSVTELGKTVAEQGKESTDV